MLQYKQIKDEYNMRIIIEIENVCNQIMKYQKQNWFEYMFSKKFVIIKNDDLKEKYISVNGLPLTFE